MSDDFTPHKNISEAEAIAGGNDESTSPEDLAAKARLEREAKRLDDPDEQNPGNFFQKK